MNRLITEYGLALVFANVLLEQLGLPIPAVPALVVAGALAAEGELSPLAAFGVAFVACMIGDAVWYLAGRRYGRRVMKFLCRVSLSPDSCVRQTEFRFERWGKLTSASPSARSGTRSGARRNRAKARRGTGISSRGGRSAGPRGTRPRRRSCTRRTRRRRPREAKALPRQPAHRRRRAPGPPESAAPTARAARSRKPARARI